MQSEKSPTGCRGGQKRGDYGWDGGFGTTWFNDPAAGLIAIVLTRRVFDGPEPPQVRRGFWKAAYAAAGV